MYAECQGVSPLTTCCSKSRLNLAFRVSDMLRKLLLCVPLLACLGVAVPFASLCTKHSLP